MKAILLLTLLSAGALVFAAEEAGVAPEDPAVKAARSLDIKIPVLVREWHVWSEVPYAGDSESPCWAHWNGETRYGRFDAAKTIETLRPGSGWRRWLNSEGYPLLGPYNSSNRDVIRWQLETAKNAGLAGMYVHLWPSLWGKGQDVTPLPTFEKILDAAAAMKYPVGFHDEVQFRQPNVSGAQLFRNSVARVALLINRYGSHPGWRKVDGRPVYYFQNWSRWMPSDRMADFVRAVECEAGPVYWVVEGNPDEAVWRIPEIRAVIAYNNTTYMQFDADGKLKTEATFAALLRKAESLARKHAKRFGVLVFSRFDDSYDRGSPDRPGLPARKGMFFVDSLRQSMAVNPDFLIVTQWNDFEECGYIEPAWDYADFEGDPYRYCRIVAASVGKRFVPAPLPPRSAADPYIRHKLFGGSKPGDLGPVADVKSKGKTLTFTWAESTPEAKAIRFAQAGLATWTPGVRSYKGEKMRLANVSMSSGVLKGRAELMFYLPGMTGRTATPRWIVLRYSPVGEARPYVSYRRPEQRYRIDSRWEGDNGINAFGRGIHLPDASDGSKWLMAPLWQSDFAGNEGDLTISIKGGKSDAEMAIREVIVWSPELGDFACAPAASVAVPTSIDRNRSYIVAAYDKAGNPGLPVLISPYSTSDK